MLKILLTLLLVLTLSCKTKDETYILNRDVNFINTNNQDLQVEGLVIRGTDNNVSILSNPDSKSRIAYIITGNYIDEIETYIDKTIVVRGKIIVDHSPWLKELEIIEILEIK